MLEKVFGWETTLMDRLAKDIALLATGMLLALIFSGIELKFPSEYDLMMFTALAGGAIFLWGLKVKWYGIATWGSLLMLTALAGRCWVAYNLWFQ